MVKNSSLNTQLRVLLNDIDHAAFGEERKVINWPMKDFRYMVKRLIDASTWWTKARYYFSVSDISEKCTSCFLKGGGKEYRLRHHSDTNKIDLRLKTRDNGKAKYRTETFDTVEAAEAFIMQNLPAQPSNVPADAKAEKPAKPEKRLVVVKKKQPEVQQPKKKVIVVRKYASIPASDIEKNVVKEITVYTDGGCHGNPGPGGWGCVILADGKETVLSGGCIQTTNNMMELTAATKALEKIYSTPEWKDASVKIFTDSQYVKNGITQWIENWKKNGWRTSLKKNVLNKDLWESLDSVSSKLNLTWEWVKGHAGIRYNEICDQLCQQEIAKF